MSQPQPEYEFVFLLQQARKGALLVDLDEALRLVVEGVQETGKGGTLTLHLAIGPAIRGNGEVIALSDRVTRRVPELDKPTSLFFALEGGRLSRRDPRQMSFLDEDDAQDETAESEEPARPHIRKVEDM